MNGRVKMRVSLLGGARELVNKSQKPLIIVEFTYKSRKRVHRITDLYLHECYGTLSNNNRAKYITGANTYKIICHFKAKKKTQVQIVST